jgi:Flp pilus assembly protein TadB
LAIVVLLLWIATASAGLTLLRAGGAARRARAAAAAAARAPAQAPVRIGAAPLTAQGKPPPIEHPRVATPAGDHTLLEFSHPALATVGVACWIMFTYVHYAPMAWIAFGTLVATLLIGLGWLTASRRAARHEENPAWSFPPRLVWLHGSIAAGTLVLTGLTAVLASRG